jgi:hypothetical protein
MKTQITTHLQKLVLMIGCMNFCGNLSAAVTYNIFDRYDEIRPDLTLGDPLDKGFSFSGTITATTGNYSADNFKGDPGSPSPFLDWNITKLVDDNGDLVADRTFNFTPANSSWDSFLTSLPNINTTLVITTGSISIQNQDVFGSSQTNELTLTSVGLNQLTTWSVPASGPFVFVSGELTGTPAALDGAYFGGGGSQPVGFAVPEPSSALYCGLVLAALGVASRRRNI